MSSTPIDIDSLKASVMTPASGACATFEGWVRNHNDGRQVSRLEYEAFEELAVKEGERVLAEAVERFGIHRAECVHRTGLLEINDVAVWVGVSSAHRDEAFRACRYIIDEIKARVPIWKKEHYVDGDSGWVNCEACAQHGHAHPHPPRVTEAGFYDRQIRLSEVGIDGQERLGRARVLVIGAGGLGCPALQYLAAAGVGTIGICEGDVLDASNLHRQPLYTPADVGETKVSLAAAMLRAQNPFVRVIEHGHALSIANAAGLFAEYDLVLDCTDNFDAKFLINDTAVRVGKPFVSASIYRYEGQLFAYRAGAACMRCVWPDAPEDGCVGSCAEVGVLGAVPGVFGALQAAESLKVLLDLPGQLCDRLVLFDLETYTTQSMRVKRSADCLACSGTTRGVFEDSVVETPLELDAAVLGLEAIRGGYALIDIREVDEVLAEPATGYVTQHLPMSRFAVEQLLPEGKPFLFFCAHGVRSRMLASRLRRLGIAHAYSLRLGLPALRRLVG